MTYAGIDTPPERTTVDLKEISEHCPDQ